MGDILGRYRLALQSNFFSLLERFPGIWNQLTSALDRGVLERNNSLWNLLT